MTSIADMPLRPKDFWIVAVASMEQLIGGAIATVIAVMVPMMQMLLHPQLPSFVQGLISAMSLIGIGLGSLIIGYMSDRMGYLLWFRLCPIIIIAGSLICWLLPHPFTLAIGLLVIGIGIGGGYSLDSSYISELLPAKWKLFMVGVAKSTCSLGFVGAALACLWVLHIWPVAQVWPRMVWVIAALGLLTLIMRIHWWESPGWLLSKGKVTDAQSDARDFLGDGVVVGKQPDPSAPSTPEEPFSIRKNLAKVIFSGIPWACEGLAVYGFSIFLPVLVMALGMGDPHAVGIHKIIGSVETTAVVNAFMIIGFIMGLLMMRRINNVKMLCVGFLFSAIGLALLLCAYKLTWPTAWMLIGFIIFEIALNAGPHILTYIIPSRIYPVAQRAEGSGVAAMMGKVGAVVGVIVMPVLLSWGGVVLVLSVSVAVMLIGALIGLIFGKKLLLI